MKNKKWLALLLAAVMVAALLSGCGNSAPAPAATEAPAAEPAAAEAPAAAEPAPEEAAGPRTIVDALGREVEIPAEVGKIVALSNTPRMIVYLGLADRVVGYSGMKPEGITPLTAYAYVTKDLWADVPIVGTDAGGNTDYYPEMILAAAPDVIFCNYAEDVANDLQNQTGIPVVSVSQGNLFREDYNDALRTIAAVCGVEDRAEEVIGYIDGCLKDLDNRTAGIADADKPSALSAAATFKGVHGIEGVRIMDQVFEAVHAVNVAKQDTTANNSTAMEVDREQILVWDPEYIFCDFGGVKLVQKDAAENPDYYAKLQAYNNGRIYQYPSSTSYYSNLEIPLANAYFVGSILYPEQFADVDLNAKANEIFKFFLGEDDFMSVLEEYGASYGPVDFSVNG